NRAARSMPNARPGAPTVVTAATAKTTRSRSSAASNGEAGSRMSVDTKPLLQDWDTPFGPPPFERIPAQPGEPALREAMAEHRRELAAIGAQTAPPTFDNTLAAFDRSGTRLSRVASAFYCLTASATSPQLQAVQRAVAAPLAEHMNAVRADA